MNSIVKKSLLLGLSLITFGGFGLSKEVKAAPKSKLSNSKSIGLLGSVSEYLPSMKKRRKEDLLTTLSKMEKKNMNTRRNLISGLLENNLSLRENSQVMQ